MSTRYPAGIIRPGYAPLKVPNAPTIDTATSASGTSVSVPFTAPSDVGGGAISAYTAYTSCGISSSNTTSPVTVTGLTTGVSYTFKVIATNAFGPSFPSAASNSVTPIAIGQEAYTTAGSYTWVAPAGVTSVSVVAVGGGGGAGDDYNGAGGGGGLGYKNNYAVTAGSSYALVVGAAGVSGKTSAQAGQAGGTSYFVSTGTVRGIGGSGGPNPQCGTNNTPGGSFTGDGGGAGGTGGRSAGGGGGAGGYAGTGGNGGTGGSGPNMAGTSGAGGGGGGGSSYGGGGGGVGILGQGCNGAGGTAPGGSNGNPGTGGSGGASGLQGSNSPNSGNGGAYGGGAGSGSRTVGCAGVGAVRIIWPGATRTFPSTNTGNL